MKRSSLLTSAAVVTAVGLSAAAAALLRRTLHDDAVDRAVRVSAPEATTGTLPVVPADAGSTPPSALPGWKETLPVTPVPPNTVTATVPDPSGEAVTTADSPDPAVEPRPARTWVVDNTSDWDGSPLELVVSPARARPRQGTPGRPVP